MNLLPVCYDYFKEMSSDEAVLLSYLNSDALDYLDEMKESIEDEKHLRVSEHVQLDIDRMEQGWIPVSIAHLQELLGLTPNIQQRCIRNLKKMGRLEVKRAGMPCRRWMKARNSK